MRSRYIASLWNEKQETTTDASTAHPGRSATAARTSSSSSSSDRSSSRSTPGSTTPYWLIFSDSAGLTTGSSSAISSTGSWRRPVLTIRTGTSSSGLAYAASSSSVHRSMPTARYSTQTPRSRYSCFDRLASSRSAAANSSSSLIVSSTPVTGGGSATSTPDRGSAGGEPGPGTERNRSAFWSASAESTSAADGWTTSMVDVLLGRKFSSRFVPARFSRLSRQSLIASCTTGSGADTGSPGG